MKCIDCKHARQVANKTTQSFVGCVELAKEHIRMSDVKDSNIYEGYIYYGRKVGDVSESDTLGRGVITLGLITEAEGYCKNFERFKE